jgi:hypothetical protein
MTSPVNVRHVGLPVILVWHEPMQVTSYVFTSHMRTVPSADAVAKYSLESGGYATQVTAS